MRPGERRRSGNATPGLTLYRASLAVPAQEHRTQSRFQTAKSRVFGMAVSKGIWRTTRGKKIRAGSREMKGFVGRAGV